MSDGHAYRMREIRPQHIQAFIDQLVRADVAPATIDAAVTPLKALFRRAVARGDVPTNPTLRLEKPAVRCKVRIVASPVDVVTRLAALDAADRPLWACAFYAGLRRGELIGLRWEDVNLAHGRHPCPPRVGCRRGRDRTQEPTRPPRRPDPRRPARRAARTPHEQLG